MIKERFAVDNKKEPFWRNKILYVWSDYYKSYVANYTPSLMLIIHCGGWEEFKKRFNMEYKEVD